MKGTKEPRTVQPEDLFRLKFLQGAQLSPDSKTILYAISHVERDKTEAKKDAEEEKEYVTLWLLSLEAGESRQLTAGPARDTNPQWSPDGKQIAFLSTRGEKPQIYLIPVDGGEARALTSMKQGVGSGPVWSPDGTKIAFESQRDGNKEIYVMDANGNHQVNLTRHEAGDDDPIWAPDSQRLVFVSNRDGNKEIYVIDIDGSHLRNLTVNPNANDLWPIWSSRGSSILFISDRFGSWDLFEMDHVGKGQKRLTSTSAVEDNQKWSPDQKQIIFVSDQDGDNE
jgi:Tol biopolymer transport system component